MNCFSFQPVLYNWCDKGCWIVQVKDPLLLITKSNPLCTGRGFPLAIYMVLYHMPYIKRVKCIVK